MKYLITIAVSLWTVLGVSVKVDNQWLPNFEEQASSSILMPIGGGVIVHNNTINDMFNVKNPSFELLPEFYNITFQVNDCNEAKMYVEAQNDNVVVHHHMNKYRKRFSYNIECAKDGKSRNKLIANVEENGKNTTFAFVKICEWKVSPFRDAVILNSDGSPVLLNGETTPKYNVFDSREPTFIVKATEGAAQFSAFSMKKSMRLKAPKIIVREVTNEGIDRLVKGNKYFEMLMDKNTKQLGIEVETNQEEPILGVTVSGKLSGNLANILLKNAFALDKHISWKLGKQKTLDAAAGGMLLDMEFHCTRTGTAVVEVIYSVLPKEMFDPKFQGKLPFAPEIRFSFVKLCEVGEYQNEALAGVDVYSGTRVPGNSAFYAIRNGVTTQYYDESDTLAISGAEQNFANFYVSYNPWKLKDENKALYITSAGVGHLQRQSSISQCESLSESGLCGRNVVDVKLNHEDLKGQQISIHPLFLHVDFRCIRPGEALVVVQLYLGHELGNQDYKLRFAFIKKCEGALRDAVIVKSVFPGYFQPIGKYSEEVDAKRVIHQDNDAPVPVFENGAMVQNGMFLTKQENTLVFQITAMETFLHTKIPITSAIRFSTPLVESSSTSCVANAYFVTRNNTDIDQKAMQNFGENSLLHQQATATNPLFVRVDHSCQVGGQSEVVLKLQIPGAEPIDIQWQKSCGWVGSKGVSLSTAYGIAGLSFVVTASLMSIIFFRLHGRRIAKYEKLPTHN